MDTNCVAPQYGIQSGSIRCYLEPQTIGPHCGDSPICSADRYSPQIRNPHRFSHPARHPTDHTVLADRVLVGRKSANISTVAGPITSGHTSTTLMDSISLDESLPALLSLNNRISRKTEMSSNKKIGSGNPSTLRINREQHIDSANG